MNKRIRVRDRYGRELGKDADGRVICPDGGVCHVDMQFLDGRGAVLRDRSREAYEAYCDRQANAHKPKDTARQVRDAKAWRWYTDWQIAHGHM